MVGQHHNPLSALGSKLGQGMESEPVVYHSRRDGGFTVTIGDATAPLGGSPHPMMLRAQPFAAILPGDGVAELVITSSITSFLQLYNAALIGRIILTWFPNPPQIIFGPLSTITDPYLNLFRGIIPPLGGTIDLSPILAFVTLDLFSSSARALPAEMGPDGKMVASEDGFARMQRKLQVAAGRRRQERAAAAAQR